MWKDIPGYEGRYQVSDSGLVRSIIYPQTRILSATKGEGLTHRNGRYRSVHLRKDGSRQGWLVHRLVMLAFVGPCPEGMEVCHNDGNSHNNHLANLRYDTRSNNVLDNVRAGLHHSANKDRCPQGHPYDAATTYVNPKGHRACIICRRESYRRKYHEKKHTLSIERSTASVHFELPPE